VHEPDHVVVRALVDRQPRVGDAGGDLRGLADRGPGRQELDLGARQQHLADLPLAGVEDLADDAPLVRAERLGSGHQLADLLLGHRGAALPGVAAEQRHDHVDGHRQQPDDRPGQRRDPVEERRREHRQRYRPLQRDPLRGELAEHQADERDAHGDDREGER
jgi:hypothetical protein